MIKPKHHVVALGDSITQGSNSCKTAWPVRLGRMLESLYPGSFSVGNYGVGGYTVSQIATRWTSCARPNTPITDERNTVVILGGINDCAVLTSAATIFAGLKGIYDDAIARGWNVIALTPAPFKNYAGWSAGAQSILEELNGSILAYSPTIVYPGAVFTKINTYALLEDVSTAKQLSYLGGVKPDYATATFTGGDSFRDFLHVNDAGQETIARAVLAATVGDSVITSGTYADPVWLTSVALSKVSGAAPTSSPTFTGTVTLPVALSGLAKMTSGVVSAASAGVDYLSPSGDGSSLTHLRRPTNTQTGTTYQLVLTDAGKLITLSNTGSITFTIPTNATVAFTAGDEIELMQFGTGTVTITKAGGVTLNSNQYGTAVTIDRVINGQYNAVALKYWGSDMWTLVGGMV